MEKKEIKQKELGADDRPIVEFKPMLDIKDGAYRGKITDVQLYDESYQYVRLYILPMDIENKKGLEIPVLKTGYPLAMSFKSGLGRLLTNAGYDIAQKS